MTSRVLSALRCGARAIALGAAAVLVAGALPAHAAPRLKLVGKSAPADREEIARNPRARSARLRVAERLPVELAA